jgi:hypothetical protein
MLVLCSVEFGMFWLERTSPSQVPEHAPDRTFEHVADLARLEVAEFVPAQGLTALVVSAVEKDYMQMGIDSQI